MFIETLERKILEDEKLVDEVRKKREADCKIQLDEEPGEILITLLMKLPDIFDGVKAATKKVFGNNARASEITLRNYRSEIYFRISID